jgi:hypothetical protein
MANSEEGTLFLNELAHLAVTDAEAIFQGEGRGGGATRNPMPKRSHLTKQTPARWIRRGSRIRQDRKRSHKEQAPFAETARAIPNSGQGRYLR